MRHFATLTLPDGVYACTAQPDGTIPLSSREVARASAHDKDGANLRYLVEQANLAAELEAALIALMGNILPPAGYASRDPGSLGANWDRARAALTRAGDLQ